jgi:glutamate/tyrosine decarboxylase-like PLP-dependent enzyme
MDERLAHDLDHFTELLRQTSDYAAATVAGLAERPAAVAPARAARRPLSEAGQGFAAALADFQARWAPGFSGSAGPRYLGFVSGGATPASLAGDWLTGTSDQNPTSGLDSSAPHLEREAVGWLRELFGLSEAHQGAFVSGTTLSNTVGLAIGREWVGEPGLSDVERAFAAVRRAV